MSAHARQVTRAKFAPDVVWKAIAARLAAIPSLAGRQAGLSPR
jgi:hypothetical protein